MRNIKIFKKVIIKGLDLIKNGRSIICIKFFFVVKANVINNVIKN